MAENRNWGALREPRLGVMLHYTGPGSDDGLVAWLQRGADCRVSYNWLVQDDGEEVPVAPAAARAWHAGVCRPSDPRLVYQDANSAFYGIALTAAPPEVASQFAFRAVLRVCRELFYQHRWSLRESWRIVGHDTEAWPRGRKIDPTGPNPKHPILDVLAIRRALTW
jgi:N-acetyl-anhydromuramyl-L-alanine amidase AmpD